MTQELLRYLLPIALGVVSSTAVHGADTNELLVFISAFAAGDKGASMPTSCKWTPDN